MSLALMQSATDRPLGLRLRRDLEFRAQQFAGRRLWAVKDPVALRFFHLREEEYALLGLLDGESTLDDLRHKANESLAPRRLTSEQVQAYLANLHRYGLVVSDAPGQGEQLLLRRTEKKQRRRIESLASLLAIRLPGMNPRWLLDLIEPAMGWIFSPAAVLMFCGVALAALGLVAVEFEAFQARLPEFDTIVSASNLPWLALSLIGIKILHELGHALACRRFGGECHELGVMVLVFTPTLYCNVSDAWMMPNKWHRIAISAAGIYVELILASICTLLWWFSQPGLFNSLCLNIVLVCSLGTILLNGNPLLRYDGYYILADLVEVPNLRAQASAALRRLLARYSLGLELPADRLATRQWQGWLVLYAVASIIYRCVVVVLVLWMLDEVLRPLHLEVLVLAVAGVALGGLAWPAVDMAVKAVRNPARRPIARARLALTFVLLAAGLAALLWVPLPMHVAAPVVVEYRDAKRVYVTVPGEIVAAAKVGQQVKAGETIATLDNPEVRLDLARLTSERDGQKLAVANLEAGRLQGGIDGAEIPAARAALADLEARLAQVTRDAQRLVLVAPIAGTVLPPPNVVEHASDRHALAGWSGTPLDEKNRGAYLETGTLVCLVGEPDAFEAIVHVDENDVELVAAGQAVSLRLDHLPAETFTGTVTDVSKLDLDVMPRELAAAGDLPARKDERGIARPLDTWYQARVRFDAEPGELIGRVHGRAKIEVAPRTLGDRLMRYVKQTFRAS